MSSPFMVMTTFDRQPAYALATLRRLYEADPSAPPLHVQVSGIDIDFLGTLPNGVVSVSSFRPDQVAELGRLKRDAKTAYCTHAALTHAGPLDVDGGPVLLLQDDLDFAYGWYSTFMDAIEELASTVDLDWLMLNLYSPFELTERPVERCRPTILHGCQAVYFGSNVRRGVVFALRGQERLGDQRTFGDDQVISRYLLESGDPVQFFTMNPSVVQHVGRETSVGSPAFSQSPTFGRKP